MKKCDRDGGDDENRSKRCQMRCLGPGWVILFFLRIIMILIDVFTEYIECINKKWDRERGDDKMGPNDARHVIWALGE